MTEVPQAETPTKYLQISHKWNLVCFADSSGYKRIPIYMNSFSSEFLPDETFYIFCGVVSETELRISVSKLSPQSARAIIIIDAGQEKKIKIIDDWTNRCMIDVIPCPIDADQHYDFSCEIFWKGFHDTKLPSHLHRPIEEFRYEPNFMIKIDDNEIHVRKYILRVYRSVITAMFRANMTESTKNVIVMKDIKVDTMKNVIQFMSIGHIYSGLPINDLLSMLHVADKYEILNLKKSCEKKLISKLSIYNVCKIYEHANLYRARDLITAGFNFMKKNIHIVTLSDDF